MALSRLPVAEVVAAAAEPAQALARHCGVALLLAGAPAGERCLCDKTLAKQAVLSSLATVLARRPRFVTLAKAARAASPRRDRGCPALPAGELELLAHEMPEPQALMQAQGAPSPSPATSRPRTAVRLAFRPAPLATVLVVDDNERMLRLYERYLMTGRYSAVPASSAPRPRPCWQPPCLTPSCST